MITGLIGTAVSNARSRDAFVANMQGRFPSLRAGGQPWEVIVGSDDYERFIGASGHAYKARLLEMSDALGHHTLCDLHFARAVMIETIISVEGDSSYHDHGPNGGGIHKWGISERHFPEVKRPEFTRADAERIYDERFIRGYKGVALLESGVSLELVTLYCSGTVLSPRAAQMALQSALYIYGDAAELLVDGIVGNNTLRVARQSVGLMNRAEFSFAFGASYIGCLAQTVAGNDARSRSRRQAWLRGWQARLPEHTVREYAMAHDVVGARILNHVQG